MTAEPKWIHKKALLLLHEESLAEFGGPRGLRDEGLLDSALTRAQNVHAYRPECTIADLAAAYAFGLAKSHAFVDGNKRAAFLSIGLFLAINGYSFKPDQVEAINFMLALANGDLDEAGLSAWIAANIAARPLSGPASPRAVEPNK